ncbi:MAG: hypothetical protein ACYDHM_05585 [Acidiferrobacterales bacterium]
MADDKQYLRIDLGDTAFLLPGSASVAVEQRENLSVNTGGGAVTAWRVAGRDRWPAFCLDRHLQPQPLSGDSWQRAVFLQSDPYPVGLAADEVQLLARSEVLVEPFTPPGVAPTRKGHLFSGASVRGGHVLFEFEPAALAAFLHQLESSL